MNEPTFPESFDLSVLINNTITYIIDSIQSYGWYLVFGYLILYFTRDARAEFFANRSLAQANDPTRVKLLNAQREKALAKQALAAAKANANVNLKDE
jgi:hypothetical protein